MGSILIIEDDPSIVRFLERIIEPLGHECRSADNGIDGVLMAVEGSVDLLLCDLQLPGNPSGLELIEILRNKLPDCPMIVVSGYPTAERLKACEDLGVQDFLTKPYEINFVREAIGRALLKG